MWVGSPVLMCSYTVAKGGGRGYAPPEKKIDQMVLSGLPKVCYDSTELKINNFKDYKLTTTNLAQVSLR